MSESENNAIYVVQEESNHSSAIYFRGSIYHSATASSDEIISSLSSMIYSSDVVKTQAALMSLMHMTMDSIREKHCL